MRWWRCTQRTLGSWSGVGKKLILTWWGPWMLYWEESSFRETKKPCSTRRHQRRRWRCPWSESLEGARRRRPSYISSWLSSCVCCIAHHYDHHNQHHLLWGGTSKETVLHCVMIIMRCCRPPPPPHHHHYQHVDLNRPRVFCQTSCWTTKHHGECQYCHHVYRLRR